MSNEHDASEQYHSQRSPDDDNEHESEVENNGPKRNIRRVAECDGNELGASHGEMMANDEVDHDHDLGPKSSSPGLPRVNGAELNYFYNSRIPSLDATGINPNFLARHTTDQSLQHASQTGDFNLPKKLTSRTDWPVWSLPPPPMTETNDLRHRWPQSSASQTGDFNLPKKSTPRAEWSMWSLPPPDASETGHQWCHSSGVHPSIVGSQTGGQNSWQFWYQPSREMNSSNFNQQKQKSFNHIDPEPIESDERETKWFGGERAPVQESPRWQCEHYRRRCSVTFSCCGIFCPCHRCHNTSGACDTDDMKANNATHVKCGICGHEEEVSSFVLTVIPKNCLASSILSAHNCTVDKRAHIKNGVALGVKISRGKSSFIS